MTKASTTRASGPESARRALEMLFCFRQDRPLVTVKQVATELDIPLPSAHRYMAMLRQFGLVAESTRDQGHYHLTQQVVALAQAAWAANTVLDIAAPYLQRLVADLDETALLAQLVGGRVVCVHRLESQRRLRMSFRPGEPLPPFRGASGKVLVGALPEADQQAYIADVLAEHPELTSQRAHFEHELTLAGKRGWATSTEEIEEGIWAASAVITESNHVVAALSAPCPEHRLDDYARDKILRKVTETAAHISTALSPGHHP